MFVRVRRAVARQGNRERILEAARHVLQTSGVTALTFDAIASIAEVTRAGVIYHFPSRSQLILALHEHLATRFEDRLEEELGRGHGRASEGERLRAYIRACAGITSRAELLFMLDGATDPEASTIWSELHARWVPSAEAIEAGPARLRAFLVRLAADGLWMYEASTGESLTPAQRRTAADALTDLLADP
ncbi:TetR/AcrR family transcriptional regulator [Leucobacter chromiisoli]|uniref:TetR/AcrR family transcriptional regulator n=1 Tax=Leucobacter chromiisoli TaxID=2796471 RepID=UPI0027DB2E50|nr:TetR/AcrR family transcriptional regulator [Leucobacter chromiisoli]